jgi:two-component system, sensor histidine kinase and response regulator
MGTKTNFKRGCHPAIGCKPVRFAIPLLLLALFLLLTLTSCKTDALPLESRPPGPDINQPYNVLVLNSYHSDFQWSADIADGIHSAFDNSIIHPEIFVEYMDTKRYPPEEIFPSLVAMYSSKYENTPLDLIIVVDNNALSFAATYYEQLFQNVPLIFVGINEFTPEMLGSISEITGIIESPNVDATIDLILKLLPETKHIVVISDNTISGKIHQEQADKAALNYAGRLEFINFADLSIDDLMDELSQIPNDSAILYLSYFRTSAGESLTVDESLQLIHENSAAPVFSTWDAFATSEAVGGALLTGKSQGVAAGNLAIQVLSGTPASRLPIVQSSPTEIILNYPELEHHQIPLSAVPAGSTIINRPETFYRQYKTLIIVGLFFLITQSLIIFNLVRENRRRRIAENDLAAAENRLDRMLQTIVDGVIVIDQNRIFNYLNPAARKYLDIPDSVKIGDPFFQKNWTPLDKNDQPLPQNRWPLFSALLSNLEIKGMIYQLVNAAGDSKWLSVSAAPIVGDDGQTVGAIATMNDVTSHQHAVQALRKSEKRFRTLFEQVVDAIIICELDGQILDVNQRACDMLNYSREEMLERSAFDITARINREDTLADWKNLGRGNISSEEGYHLKNNKEPIPVELSVGLIELEGQDRILIVSRDITERQQARQILLDERTLLEKRVEERTAELRRLNAELHKAARAKDDFLANMSHELRTPLNAVLGMSEMLGDELHGPLNERQHRYVKTIENSGNHLLDLINDILDLSKIEAGQRNLNIQPVQLDDLCLSTLHIVQQLALQKNIEILFQNTSEQTILHADPRSVKQILVNIFANAIKFSSEDGKVEFFVEDVAELDALRFTIKDNGIGIAPNMMPQLFKPFFQIDSSLSRSYEGTGLGLALVSRLVDMHGGCITLESTGISGEGCIFTVTLPRNQQLLLSKNLLALVGQFKAKHAPTGHVLLAEANETAINEISSTLESLGYRVEIAHSGTEVLQQARINPPQFLLLNMQIPEMDGWQILSILKSDNLLQKIPVLCLTSLMVTGDPQRYTDAGITTFLTKPLHIETILDWLQDHKS